MVATKDDDYSKCIKCVSENVYFDGSFWICPDCGHEWLSRDNEDDLHQTIPTSEQDLVKDAHGAILKDGDQVTLIKDLRLKGSSTVIKVGSKAKGIRLADNGDGHNIVGKIEGHGLINLKSEFVKKV